ncbi:hypothetical protein [Erwinia sp. SLM-02]|uniref:hypothetical protein n=1 Tax=Erwinia sp. SLM-02 TaxID=3020057 RepID=UPI0030808A83
MISQPVMISAAIALVWLVVIALLVKRGSLGKISALLLLVVPLVAGNLYYFRWMAPQQAETARLDAAQQKLAMQPVWRTIKTQQPALYRQASDELLSGLHRGLTEQQAFDRLRPLAADLLNQRINSAADDDLTGYMKVSLEEMKQLRQQSADRCFRFLFPQVRGGVDIAELLPPSLVESEMQAMDRLLINSGGGDRVVDLPRGRKQLQSVVKTLYGKWGSDLQTLNTPAEAGVDESKLCDMTIDLYKSVLALADKDSANVLRIIISGTGN